MLALTHSHLALGDYKFQHPPLATRPRPLLKAGLGPSPPPGQVALGVSGKLAPRPAWP